MAITEDGQKRSKYEVVAQTVRFLSKKSGVASSPEGEDIAPPDETTDLEPF